jgi:4-hydroxy-tetrahydrodipicolinate synthase
MTKFAPSTYVISLTPFDDQDRVDVEALRAHLRRMADGGVGVYVAGGGSGEGYTLAADEVDTILHVAAEELTGRVPVRAMGVEPRTAKEMIGLAARVQAAGLECMQVYSLDAGHDRKPSDRELETYFTDILDNVSVQCVVSSHFSVGYFIPIDMLERLVGRYDHIVGLNVTSPDVGYLSRVVDAVGDRVEIHVGGPMQGLTALSLGATGFLTSEANLAPKLCRSVIDRWVAGDLAGAADAFGLLLRLFTGLSSVGGVSGTKAALGVLGLPGGVPRRPRLPVPPEWVEQIRVLLDQLDIRSVEGL